ncbi:pyridoxine/pyridoxamine 5'-phosphate oxidase [Pseudoneobacillus rhizosphaerae]|uniref:Pyridoxine/pyridoxamine 5'-phosphate oxidase n=1 Tax=Pseudoneobacillus rhizosphaerae TaxID=2880968 RepID=A0A9C7G6K0_9BACI|nr:pyridoxal 5'-phosphate synthase [Pseudoneobacillus rhizosphaerae]CAG9606954.1 Pyridoxine/pyridoxamine 5'-phosphate oxidase [Pseudoneobacillus rhizosphaerae]
MDEIIRQRIRNSKTLLGPFPNFFYEKTPDYPQALFLEWFQVAVESSVHEPHSMTISTIDQHGSPDSRVLILKDIDNEGWYFASSSQSAKGKQIEINSKVALNFYWSEIGRQVRIRGNAVTMNKERSSKDFLERGKIAKAIALLEKQSLILQDPHELEEALTKQLIKLNRNPKLISPSWTLYKVEATEVEFWQADKERKHIRLQYNLRGEKWVKNLLWP